MTFASSEAFLVELGITGDAPMTVDEQGPGDRRSTDPILAWMQSIDAKVSSLSATMSGYKSFESEVRGHVKREDEMVKTIGDLAAEVKTIRGWFPDDPELALLLRQIITEMKEKNMDVKTIKRNIRRAIYTGIGIAALYKFFPQFAPFIERLLK
jgi:hypothetical protein